MCSKEPNGVERPKTMQSVTEESDKTVENYQKQDIKEEVMTPVEKDILGEADAAAIAACLDPAMCLAEDGADPVDGDMIGEVTEPAVCKIEDVPMEVDDDPITTKANDEKEKQSTVDKTRGKKATYTSKSIMPIGMKKKLSIEMRSEKNQKTTEKDPTYVVEDSGESSDEYYEPIKRRLRRAPKRRKVGVLDTFTQHLEKRRSPRGRKPQIDLTVSTVSNSPTIVTVTDSTAKKFILNDDTNELTREQLLKLKEKNIEQLKDLIRQQEEAMEEIKKGKIASNDESIKIVINSTPTPTTTKKEVEPGKASTGSVRSSPLLLPKVVSVVPNGIKLPVSSSNLSPSITSFQVSPRSNIVKLVSYCTPGQTNTLTSTKAKPKPLVIRGKSGMPNLSTSAVHHSVNSPVAANVAAATILNHAKRIAASPTLIRRPDVATLANPMTTVRPKPTVPSVTNPTTNAVLRPPASSAVNLSLVRLPTATQAPGNIPGVFVNVPIPNSTGQQLVFVPTPASPAVAGVRPQPSLTPSAATAVMPSVLPSQVGVNSNNSQLMVLPLQQAANGIRLQRPLLVKQPTTPATVPLISHPPAGLHSGLPRIQSVFTDHTRLTHSVSKPEALPGSSSYVFTSCGKLVPAHAINTPIQPSDSLVPMTAAANEMTNLKSTDIKEQIESLNNVKQLAVAGSTIAMVPPIEVANLNVTNSMKENPEINSTEMGLADVYKEKAKARLDDLLREQQEIPAESEAPPTGNEEEKSRAVHLEMPSLLHAKEILKNALTAKISTQTGDEKKAQSDNLSVLKNALKSAFASDALKPVKATITDNTKPETSPIVGYEMAKEAEPQNFPIKAPDSSPAAVTTTQVGSVLYKKFSSMVKVDAPQFASVIAGSYARNTNIGSVAQGLDSSPKLPPHTKRNIILGQNVKTKILSHNGQYVATSLPNLGLVNTISSTNGKQVYPVLAGKKNSQQLSGILVKLKDGGVRFVKLSEPSKQKTTSEDEVQLVLGTGNPEVTATAASLSSVPTMNMAVIPQVVSPLGHQSDGTQVSVISTPVCSTLRSPPSVIPIAPKPDLSGNVMRAPPEATDGFLCDDLPPLRNINDHGPRSPAVAVLNSRTSNNVTVSTGYSFPSATIALPSRSPEGHQKVGITLGKQEKLIQLDSRTKEIGAFFPCADDMDFTCLTGLEMVVDTIHDRVGPRNDT